MASLVLIIVSAYCLIAVGAAAVVAGGQRSRPTKSLASHSVVVVVAARNEEDALPTCLAALKRQEHTFRSLRFVVVDDHSEDGTVSVARTFAANDKRFLVTSSKDGSRGKAAALAHGISLLESDIIVTTDADCTPPKGWLEAISQRLLETNSDVLCGPTVVTGGTWIEKAQRLDWLNLFGVAGAFSAVGLPITGMGNNMAIRREVYDAVGGFDRFTETATEDYALFRAANQLPAGRSRLLLEPRLVNYTAPESNLASVFEQRKRWARGGLDAAWWVKLLYMVVWASHACALALLLYEPFTGAQFLAAIVCADAIVLATTGWRIAVKVPWLGLPAFEMLKFTYIVAMPVVLLIRPGVDWRGKTY
ncbi:MAG: glycosyltransferase [Rhodothermia bacterium]|nr:glycosyltransferase [Rhodothermia bacterium]